MIFIRVRLVRAFAALVVVVVVSGCGGGDDGGGGGAGDCVQDDFSCSCFNQSFPGGNTDSCDRDSVGGRALCVQRPPIGADNAVACDCRRYYCEEMNPGPILCQCRHEFAEDPHPDGREATCEGTLCCLSSGSDPTCNCRNTDIVPCTDDEIQVPSCDPATFQELIPPGTTIETPAGNFEFVETCLPG